MQGSQTPIAHNGLKTQEHNGITWLDVSNPDSEALAKLERDYQLDPIHLTECVQKVQHTEVERESNYIFLVLHFPVFEPHTDKIFAGQLGVFLGKDYLITVRSDASPVLQDLFVEGERNPEQYFGQGVAYLLYVLVNKLLGSIGSITDLVEGELDEIETLVFENYRSDAQRIGRVRQKIIRLKRLIGPKRELLRDLADEIDSFTGQDLSKLYSSNVKLANKLWEAIKEAKETVEIYKDADFTTSTEHTNRILAILTLVFTFTIPVTVVGTLYGMNVDLPGGLEAGPWRFFGTFTTFWILVTASLLLALVMFFYFRKKKWF